MAQRKNPFVKMGRPKGSRLKMPDTASCGPTDNFRPSLPASSFKRGSSSGYGRMPNHHDDPSFAKGGKVR